MIRAIIIRFILYVAIALAFTYTFKAKAESLNLEEPAISIYQGTEPGTNVIVLQWPDGKTERLVIKKGERKDWEQWFRERLETHDRGSK
jgi:hypothetical protein